LRQAQKFLPERGLFWRQFPSQATTSAASCSNRSLGVRRLRVHHNTWRNETQSLRWSPSRHR